MKKVILSFCWRQVIDKNSMGEFEKKVWADSYQEFLLQAQAYNADGLFDRFEEIRDNNAKANSLHYKLGFSVGLYIQSLKRKIPGLKDSLGRSLAFGSHRFELIDSSITDPSVHHVAVNYISERFLLIDTIGNYLLLSPVEEDPYSQEPCFMLALQEGLSICCYEAVSETAVTLSHQ